MILEVDSATGTLVRTIGAVGEGPGEYRDIGAMLMQHDSLVLQNPLSGTLSIYSPTGEFVRSQSFAVAIQAGEAIRLRGDTTLVVEPRPAPETFGLPIHLVAPNGIRLRSFGAEDRTIDPDFFAPQLRVLAKASDSSVWVARRDRYEIERWNTLGEREKRLAPVREWFPPMTKDIVNPTTERPETQLGGLSVDGHGHLVVMLLRARSGWRPAPSDNSSPFPLYDPLTRFEPFEAVIEVLDAESGTLLSSGVFRNLNSSGRFLSNGLLVGYTTTQDDAPALALWAINHIN